MVLTKITTNIPNSFISSLQCAIVPIFFGQHIMFDTLTERLTRTFKNLRGQGRLTEENVQHALREVRLSLLEADVALPVIKEFIEQVKQKALGQEVLTDLNPDQAFV